MNSVNFAFTEGSCFAAVSAQNCLPGHELLVTVACFERGCGVCELKWNRYFGVVFGIHNGYVVFLVILFQSLAHGCP